MATLIVVLSVFFSALLVLIILIQDGKSGGFSSSASGAASLMGVKKSTDILEQLSYAFIGCIMLVSISSSFILGGEESSEDGLVKSVNMQKAAGSAPAQKPAAPAQNQTAPAATGADSAAK
jgi:preprotein translocase subunit SecG